MPAFPEETLGWQFRRKATRLKETRIPTGQAVAGEDQTRQEREKYGQRLKRREEKGKLATGGSRDGDVEMYDAEKPPKRPARLQGLPADDGESSGSVRETSEEEESEPDQEVRMPVENEWGEHDGSVALLKQSKAPMQDNTLRIPIAEINAAGRVEQTYFELSTYERRSRGSKQLENERNKIEKHEEPGTLGVEGSDGQVTELKGGILGDGGFGKPKELGREKRKEGKSVKGSERESKCGDKGSKVEEKLCKESDSLRILRLHLDRQGAPLAE
ncbi:hypothetical protein HDV00_010862 [Rhizophlyctis rosea]|nr:hypothetical protein HDV00_010862 [Rhizophlyctis rosea]